MRLLFADSMEATSSVLEAPSPRAGVVPTTSDGSSVLKEPRRSPNGGQHQECPLDGDQMRDHLQCLGVSFEGIGPAGDLVEVVADARDLPGALALDLGVRHGPGAHPANRPAHQIRQRQPCGACLRVPLGTLRLAGANLQPQVASSGPHVPLPLGGSEGAQPLASPCRGPAKRGPKG